MCCCCLFWNSYGFCRLSALHWRCLEYLVWSLMNATMRWEMACPRSNEYTWGIRMPLCLSARSPTQPSRTKSTTTTTTTGGKKELHIMAIGNNNISDRKKQSRMHTHAHTAHAVPREPNTSAYPARSSTLYTHDT